MVEQERPAPASGLYYPPDVSGWNDNRWLDTNTTVGRWEAVGVALAGKMVKNAGADVYPEQTPRPVARRLAFWGDPPVSSEARRAAARLRPGVVPATGNPSPSAAGAAIQRAAPAGRGRTRPPDRLRTPMDACHCKEHSRAAILRQAAAASAAGAGAGLRAIEPGMPLPAGTGLSRRSFLARSTGLALAVFGGSRSRRARTSTASPTPWPPRRAEHRAGLGLPRRRPRHALAARAGRRPDVPDAAPDAEAGAEPGADVRRRPAAPVARARRRRATCTSRTG